MRIRWIAVMVAMVAGCCATAVLWAVIAPKFGWDGWPVAGRAIGAVLPIAILGWLIVAPWKERPAVD